MVRRTRDRLPHGAPADGRMGVRPHFSAAGTISQCARSRPKIAMTDDTSLEARNYSANAVLRDGGSIHIRAIRADDKDRLLDHFRHMSQDSIYHRFFGLKRSLSDQDLVRFTEIDFTTHTALVATLLSDGGERFIGVGQYVTTGPARAEVAFAVLDEHQGRGVG